MVFEGEPGVDEGGVRKDFFQILIWELFDTEYGMFEYNQDSHMFWFKHDSFETPVKYEMIGIAIGVAIFNGVILDIHLPMATYKKLLGVNPSIQDLRQYNPKMAKSLQAILDSRSEDLQSELYLKFEV